MSTTVPTLTVPEGAVPTPAGYLACCGGRDVHSADEPCNLRNPRTLAEILRRALTRAHMELIDSPDDVSEAEWQRVRVEVASWLNCWAPRSMS